jgi:cell division protease FtsH
LCSIYVRRYHKLTLTLLKASWRRAQQLVASRADAIRGAAAALLAADDERLEGPALVDIIEVRAAAHVHCLDKPL